MTRKIILILIVILPILGCNGKRSITVYSPDKAQLLRFEKVGDNVLLYEANDEVNPSVILDYEHVDLAGQIYLKWIKEDGQYSWRCCFHKSRVVRNDLACTNCRVITEFPPDSIGGPSLEGFEPPNYIRLQVDPFRIIGETDLRIN